MKQVFPKFYKPQMPLLEPDTITSLRSLLIMSSSFTPLPYVPESIANDLDSSYVT